MILALGPNLAMEAPTIGPGRPKASPDDRYAFTVNWTSRGMTYSPGVQFSAAFLKGRGVDIKDHLEKKLLVKVEEKK